MTIYYIGLDIHKKTVAFCIKKSDGEIIEQGSIPGKGSALANWLTILPGAWIGAMEATIFTGWIYDFLKPHAEDLKVANSQMLKVIVASKKKNDRIDAQKIEDLLRCNLLPECYMAPEDIRELRRVLR